MDYGIIAAAVCAAALVIIYVMYQQSIEQDVLHTDCQSEKATCETERSTCMSQAAQCSSDHGQCVTDLSERTNQRDVLQDELDTVRASYQSCQSQNTALEAEKNSLQERLGAAPYDACAVAGMGCTAAEQLNALQANPQYLTGLMFHGPLWNYNSGLAGSTTFIKFHEYDASSNRISIDTIDRRDDLGKLSHFKRWYNIENYDNGIKLTFVSTPSMTEYPYYITLDNNTPGGNATKCGVSNPSGDRILISYNKPPNFGWVCAEMVTLGVDNLYDVYNREAYP